jgi:hypothetical protein
MFQYKRINIKYKFEIQIQIESREKKKIDGKVYGNLPLNLMMY